MIHFRNDYSAGAHPAVLEALVRTNGELTPGYGGDPYCRAAADTIRTLCAAPKADVHFLVGGTQVNKTALGAFLRPYEAVIAADTAHICVHETGAIEQNGHKVIHCLSQDGKVTPEVVRMVWADHSTEHMVVPRLVYVSNTTEVGTVYTRGELECLAETCRELDLYLYCDGARLGSAMDAGDTSFADYAALCDAFTIGGTKNGLLFGEALVITRQSLQPGFRHCMKQQGAVLAKGRLLGVQYSAILEGNLYQSLAAHANRLAHRLTEGLKELGVSLLVESPSNQVFPILPAAVVEALAEEFTFEVQRKLEQNQVCVRFVTAWCSTQEDVESLLTRLEALLA